MARLIRWLVILGVVGFALIQLLPYRVHNHPAAAIQNWDSPRTQRLFNAACADCHSNHASSHLYEHVAPISWWIANHVSEGRARFNMSVCPPQRAENRRFGGDRHDAGQTVRRGSMPPSYYTWFGLHSGAKLTQTQKQELADGLAATLQRGCKAV
jgi:heme-binding protein